MRTVLNSAAVLALLLGIWTLVPDLVARVDSADHGSRLAARIAAVRSDVWAEAARTSARSSGTSDVKTPEIEGGASRSAAVRALRLSPLNAEVWLALASRISDPTHQEPALTMSFFTGPGDPSIVDRRLTLVARNPRFGQAELCSLLRPDVDFEIRRGGVGRIALHNALADAPPANTKCLKDLMPGGYVD